MGYWNKDGCKDSAQSRVATTIVEEAVNDTLSEMIRTDMFFPMKETTIQQWGGKRNTKRKRTSTRKQKLHIVSFSN
jgi:hypothetical protein